MKKKIFVVLTAVGEAAMFYLGAVIILTLATWLLSGIVNRLNLNGHLHNLSFFLFISGLFALTVFVFSILFLAVVKSERFIDVIDRDTNESNSTFQKH